MFLQCGDVDVAAEYDFAGDRRVGDITERVYRDRSIFITSDSFVTTLVRRLSAKNIFGSQAFGVGIAPR